MTMVNRFNELCKLAEIAHMGIAKMKKEIERANTVVDVELIIRINVIKTQEDTEKVTRASLREEAADGIIPPKNGGTFQTGGEHGAGCEEYCKKMNFRTVEEVNKEAEKILNGDEEHINKCAFKTKDGKCIRRIKSCVYTQN